LLGYKELNEVEEQKLKLLISDCFYWDWNNDIKQRTIALRRGYKIKLPDAIIAATSLVYNVPLITFDKGFSKIRELDLIVIDI
jgi:predicted nucleic acid-binding protein